MIRSYFLQFLTLLGMLFLHQLKSQTITTIAGTGAQAFGGDGGLATSAWLSLPVDVEFDALGNVIIADRGNNRLRKITSGTITTISGSNTPGSSGDGGPAINALMNNPHFMCKDANGNIYITEFFNNKVRRISPSGTITTVVGTGSMASTGDGGLAINASLNGPTGIAMDALGNLYVAESSGNKIRKVSPGGIISTYAGTGVGGAAGDGGPANLATVNSPRGMKVDANGNLFFCDLGNNKVRMITPGGTITTAVGTGSYNFFGDGGPALLAHLRYPSDLAFDPAGDLYIADGNNHRIRKVNMTTGIITTMAGTGVAGSSGDGLGPTFAQLSSPVSVSIYTNGNVYIGDSGNNKIRLITGNCVAPGTPTNMTSPGNHIVCGSGNTSLTAVGLGTVSWFSGPSGGTALSSGSLFITPNVTTTTTFYAQANTCVSSNSRIAITVSVLPLPNVSASVSNSLICNGASVAITPTAGGTGPFTYSISGGVLPGAPFTPSVTTNYTITGTDANGCSNSDVRTVIVLQPPNLSINASSTVVCQGSPVTLSGSGAIVYLWSGGITDNVPFVPLTTSNYILTGVNACGSLTTAITISVTPLPNVLAHASATSICAGQQLTLTGSGANSYTWTSGVINGQAFTPTISQTYTVIGSNAIGCQNSATISVPVNPLPNLNVVASNTEVCQGNTLTLNASGALTYTWSGGISNGVAFTPAASGNYTLSATDALGCQNTLLQTVSVVALPAVSAVSSNSVICNGFSTTLFASGASTYSWSGGVVNGVAFTPTASNVYTVVGSNACGISSTTLSVVVNPLPNVGILAATNTVCLGSFILFQGTGASSYTWSGGINDNVAFSPSISSNYTLTGTGANGCQNSATIAVTVYSLPVISAMASGTLVCSGNTVVLSGQGGVAYLWSGGVVNNSPFTPTVTGSYTVNGVDAFGCQNTAAITLSVMTLPNLQANATSTAVCSGNSVTLFGSGADTYSWSSGVINNSSFVPSSTSVYTLTGTNFCGNVSTTIQVVVQALPSITINVSPSPTVCQGNTLNILASGATTYTWTGGISNGVAFTPTANGTYTLTGANALGCQSSAIQTIALIAAPNVSIIATSTSVCSGNSVALTGSGANTFTWSGGINNGVPFSPTVTSTYSLVGTQTLTGCTSTNVAVVTVSVKPLPNVVVTPNYSVSCAGSNNAFYGSGANTYTWSNGFNTSWIYVSLFTNTVYAVVGTNTQTGCSNTATISVPVLPSPTLTVTISNPIICSGQSVVVNASGAISYTIYSGQQLGVPFTPTVSGGVNVVGSNSLGCTGSAGVNYTVIQSPNVNAIASNTGVCSGSSITLTGSGTHTYTWSSGVTNAVPFTPSSTSIYSVTGTSTVSGCSKTSTILITVYPLPTVSAQASNTLVCQGSTVTLNGSGANFYTWTGGVQNGVPFVVNQNSIYSVSGTSTLTGCTSSVMAVQQISVNPAPVLVLNQLNPSICIGNTIALSATGANTFSWSGGISNGQVLTPTASSVYSCTGTFTQTGCSSTISTSLTVNALPIITITASSQTLCAGHALTLTASGANTYTWSSGLVNGQVFFPTVSTNYSVSGTNTLTGCVGTKSIHISTIPSPVLQIIATATNLCIGDSVAVSVTGAPNYTWSSGVVNGVYFSPTVSQLFTVSANSASSNCVAQSTVQINVNPLPTVQITASDTLICDGEEIVLTGMGAATYTWNTGFIGTNYPVIPAFGQTFSVQATDANGCKGQASFSPNLTECLGLQMNGNQELFSIYPNPSSGIIMVKTSQAVEISVINELGQLILTRKVNGTSLIEFSNLDKGMYSVIARFDQGSKVIKLIVQ